jgi:hypothetical protein
MLDIADRLDRHLISIVDGFCNHLQRQLRIPFAWMISGISLGTGVIAFTAAMLMFGGDDSSRLPFIVVWVSCFALMIFFLERSLWSRMRRWHSEDVLDHWAGMARMMRDNGRVMRFVAVGGTILLLPGAIMPLLIGAPEVGLRSLKFLFVNMVPVTLMMYAFCALPLPPRK